MINQIRKIIKEPQLGIDDLIFQYEKLTSGNQREEFLTALVNMATEGSEVEKIYCFNVIYVIGKAKDEEDIIKQNVDNLTFSESESLIDSLLRLAASISKKWCIDFIQEVIQRFKPQSTEYSRLFNEGIRSIVTTQHWKDAINEIMWALEHFDNAYIVDFLAYFRWKRGKIEEDELYRLIKSDKDLFNKINHLRTKIENRYINNYAELTKIMEK
jgi:hypothetical protein